MDFRAAECIALHHEWYQWEISRRGGGLATDRWQLPPGQLRGVPECRSTKRYKG